VNQLIQILLQTVIGPEIVKLFAERQAAGLPLPSSDDVIAIFNSHVDQKVAEGVAFLLSKGVQGTQADA
jgi:hypothetical protein